MSRILRFALVLAIIALIAHPVSAQVPTGTPPFSSSTGGPDVINVANLNAHITVPIFHKAGRGLPFDYDMSYDSSVWYPLVSGSSKSWQPVQSMGWRASLEANFGYIQRILLPSTTCAPPNQRFSASNMNWFYKDPTGVSHYFGETTAVEDPCGFVTTTSLTNAPALDGSGYTFNATGSTVGALFSSTGQAINVPVNFPGAGSATLKDRNGNEISTSSTGVFTDTLGGTVLTVAGSGTPTSPVTFTYPAPSGASAAYTMKYTAYTIQTKFNCSGVSEYGPTATNLVSEIDLPDILVNANDKYIFTYEITPGDAHTPHYVTGRIASVTLPTGGTISHAYSGGGTGVNGISCTDGSGATITRTTPDTVGSSWTYAQVKGTGAASTTTITDPQGNQTVAQFQGIYETQRQVYQGATSGTLLRTWNTCYNGSTSPCSTTTITLPITERTVLDQYGSAGLQCKHNYIYNTVGGLTEQDDYDYGSGAPGSLLRKTLVTFAALGNITAFNQQVTVQNGAGTVISQTTYNYDQTTPTATSGVAQHVAVTGSRGNLTSINYPVSGLTSSFTYYDTGSPNTAIDINGATTTFNYSSPTNDCQMAFSTSISEPLSLSRSMTWNCTGGVQLTTTDEDSQVTSATYSDQYFWRPANTNDQLNNVTSFAYVTNPMSAQQQLLFNGNNSVAHTGLGFDGLGRLIFTDHAQSPSQTAWDAVQQSYDSNGRSWKTSTPCVTTGAWTCPTTDLTTTYDPLNRISQITDAGGGTANYTYLQNDALIAVGPAPTGENTKRRQLEYNSIGQLTSVCELTTLTGSGTCGQTSAQTGYWTKYTYDALGDLLTVTQNAQAASGSWQPRSYTYDGLSRLVSETNPESGTVNYRYDTVPSSCYNFGDNQSGNLTARTDANGNVICYHNDALHRLSDIGTGGPNVSPCKRFRYDLASYGVNGSAPSGVSVANIAGRLMEAETDNCGAWPPTPITDEWFSYTARGEVSDVYESTPHSGAYYHSASTYWANGAPNQLTGYVGSTLNYSFGWNLDGEGRPLSDGLESSVTYNVASQPTQVNFTWGDSDSYTYDPYTGAMTQYKFTVNSQSNTGALTWNPNGTLSQLAITDAFNSANTQTCTYGHDDLVRILSANCGTAASQTFSYDPFGNLNKSGSPFSFQPTYSNSTNRMTSLGSYTPTYDNDGNLLSDNLHSYTWDAYGNSASMDAVTTLTFDALDRMVEQNRSGAYTQFLYSPTGFKMEILNGQTVARLFVPLAGGGTAVYSASALLAVRHPDWLGSSRFASTPSRAMYYDGGYAPFGETYAQSGTTDLSFTGMNSDTTSGVYDFLYRPYSSQGRWPTPDPAGFAAADPTNPQSWNRYSYVQNYALMLVDPLGLCGEPPGIVSIKVGGVNAGSGTFTSPACEASGGVRLTPEQMLNESGGGSGCAVNGVAGICVTTFDGGQAPRILTQPTLRFRPPSWHNFTYEFLPCYGSQLLSGFVGTDNKAQITFVNVASFAIKPIFGGPLLSIWSGVVAFNAGSSCAVASRGYYQ